MHAPQHKPARVMILDNEFGMGGVEKKLFEVLQDVDRDRFSFSVCCLKSGGYFKQEILELGLRFYDRLLAHRFDLFAFRLGQVGRRTPDRHASTDGGRCIGRVSRTDLGRCGSLDHGEQVAAMGLVGRILVRGRLRMDQVG